MCWTYPRGYNVHMGAIMVHLKTKDRLLAVLGIFCMVFLIVLMLAGQENIPRDLLLRSNLAFGSWAEHQRNNSLAIQRLDQACIELAYIGKYNYQGRKNRQIYSSKQHNFAVCVVPKTGCTFMKQLVYYLNDPRDWNKAHMPDRSDAEMQLYFRKIGSLQNRVFDIPRMTVHHEIDFQPLQITLNQFVESTGLKVVHARNPYSRLYSAYIDKAYIPARWDLLLTAYKVKLLQKKKITAQTRVNACNAKFETFEDFLETVLLMAEYRSYDQHWGPISTMCDPCQVKPDIIIRQESYQEDVQYLLQKLSVNSEQLVTINNAIAKQGVQTDVYLSGLIKTMYAKGIEGPEGKCFSNVEMAYRVWKALKIQGQLYSGLDFPYSKFHNNPSFDAVFVAKVFITEMKRMPVTAEESQMQRQRALARAYRNIRPEILIQIQGLYYHDFKMFGYDFNPPKIP